jgi:polyribonucleotide nucleotidyltransferase
MDIKIKGISYEIMETALQQAKEGRMHILDIMEQTIATPRESLSKYAPHLTTIQIPVEMIGKVIGPAGKTIRAIVQASTAEINIDDDGRVVIAAVSKEASEKALEMISRLVEVPEVGKVYKGKVKRLFDFGAMVEFLPEVSGLVHISQLDKNRVNKVEDVVKVGDEIEVKLVEVDNEGRYNLSRKALLLPDGGDGEGGHLRRHSSQHRSGGGHERHGGHGGGRRH